MLKITRISILFLSIFILSRCSTSDFGQSRFPAAENEKYSPKTAIPQLIHNSFSSLLKLNSDFTQNPNNSEAFELGTKIIREELINELSNCAKYVKLSKCYDMAKKENSNLLKNASGQLEQLTIIHLGSMLDLSLVSVSIDQK